MSAGIKSTGQLNIPPPPPTSRPVLPEMNTSISENSICGNCKSNSLANQSESSNLDSFTSLYTPDHADSLSVDFLEDSANYNKTSSTSPEKRLHNIIDSNQFQLLRMETQIRQDLVNALSKDQTAIIQVWARLLKENDVTTLDATAHLMPLFEELFRLIKDDLNSTAVTSGAMVEASRLSTASLDGLQVSEPKSVLDVLTANRHLNRSTVRLAFYLLHEAIKTNLKLHKIHKPYLMLAWDKLVCSTISHLAEKILSVCNFSTSVSKEEIIEAGGGGSGAGGGGTCCQSAECKSNSSHRLAVLRVSRDNNGNSRRYSSYELLLSDRSDIDSPPPHCTPPPPPSPPPPSTAEADHHHHHHHHLCSAGCCGGPARQDPGLSSSSSLAGTGPATSACGGGGGSASLGAAAAAVERNCSRANPARPFTGVTFNLDEIPAADQRYCSNGEEDDDHGTFTQIDDEDLEVMQLRGEVRAVKMENQRLLEQLRRCYGNQNMCLRLLLADKVGFNDNTIHNEHRRSSIGSVDLSQESVDPLKEEHVKLANWMRAHQFTTDSIRILCGQDVRLDDLLNWTTREQIFQLGLSFGEGLHLSRCIEEQRRFSLT